MSAVFIQGASRPGCMTWKGPDCPCVGEFFKRRNLVNPSIAMIWRSRHMCRAEPFRFEDLWRPKSCPQSEGPRSWMGVKSKMTVTYYRRRGVHHTCSSTDEPRECHHTVLDH